MKMKKLTYLFAICPAVVALASCSGGNGLKTPGTKVKYEEAYSFVENNFSTSQKFNENLVKHMKIDANFNKFIIDGEYRSKDESTGEFMMVPINLNLPTNNNFEFEYDNEGGASAAAFVRYNVERDRKSTNLVGKNPNNQSKQKSFVANLPAIICSPFLTKETLAYAHEVIGQINNFDIINAIYTIENNENLYFTLEIGDLKQLTDLMEKYETSQGVALYSIFRGQDGHASLSLGFNKYGYLTMADVDVESTSMQISNQTLGNIGYKNKAPLYNGAANVKATFNLTPSFYGTDEMHRINVYNDVGARLAIKAPEYDIWSSDSEGCNGNVSWYTGASNGSSKYTQDIQMYHAKRAGARASFFQSYPDYISYEIYNKSGLSDYKDYLIPGYGTDFVIPAWTTDSYGEYPIDPVKTLVRIGGVEYSLWNFSTYFNQSNSYVWDTDEAYLDSSAWRDLGNIPSYSADEWFKAIDSTIQIVVVEDGSSNDVVLFRISPLLVDLIKQDIDIIVAYDWDNYVTD